MTKLRITFLDIHNQEHTLTYKIYDSGLAHKWLDILSQNQALPEKYIHGTFYNVSSKDIPEIHAEIISTIKSINDVYHITLPLYQDCSVLSTVQLNHLHFMFEEHGACIPELEAKNLHRIETHLMFLRLNELIHTYESALEISTGHFPEMAVMFDYYPQTIFRNIEPLDKLYIQRDSQWGALYLGYNTLGKDWLTVAGDNDVDLVDREQVNPQERFAAETWMCFRKDEDCISKSITFEKWFNSLSPELQVKVPINDLSNMVLGKFLIGELLLDSYFLNFEASLSKWKHPHSFVKHYWNIEVLSTFRKISKIEIIK